MFEVAATRDLTVVGLHDCYADGWLDRYPELLENLRDMATIRTLDEVSADLILSGAD